LSDTIASFSKTEVVNSDIYNSEKKLSAKNLNETETSEINDERFTHNYSESDFDNTEPNIYARDHWKKPYSVIADISNGAQVTDDEIAAFPELTDDSISKLKRGDGIAFQELTLCEETFRPKLSDYRYACVISTAESSFQIHEVGTAQKLIAISSKVNRVRPNECIDINVRELANVRAVVGQILGVLENDRKIEMQVVSAGSEKKLRAVPLETTVLAQKKRSHFSAESTAECEEALEKYPLIEFACALKRGDIIAFQELGFNEEKLRPELSKYQFGQVIEITTKRINLRIGQSLKVLNSEVSTTLESSYNLESIVNIRVSHGPSRVAISEGAERMCSVGEENNDDDSGIASLLAKRRNELQEVIASRSSTSDPVKKKTKNK
jgi:hypothetical protein